MAYEPSKYIEYFEVDEGYYPEINESSIKDPKNKWQSTFPHKDIVEILKTLERALSRSEKKSLWVEGTYGTGKSRILWMMQNLLSCPENEFDAYFDEYDNLRGEIDLRERLRTARNGKIVTAVRYATGDITSTPKLVFAVFESLTRALKNSDCKFDGAKTLRGKIAGWLESDKANLEMFRAKIRKPEYRMAATLANRTAEEIIERLKNPEAEVSQLVEEILKLGEREGIRAFNIDMRDLLDWITEVLDENKLKAIILFWDEFSKFFGNNRNNLDEFQRLAELTNIAPFYLVIATHESQSLAGQGDQAFQTIFDRFTHKEIKMPDNIALELIGHALKVKKVAQERWEYFSATLKGRTSEPRKVVMNFAKITDEKILTDILPIHPMTAVLLKNLASYFASNQRSVFNFIKNTDPNIKAFQDFIATKSPYDGDLLTIDYLWNFFYESGTDEHGGHVGRMNLKPSIRAILDSYSLNKENLRRDEQTVLKTILLFQAIDQESRLGVDIFRATEKNLELAFAGAAEMENGRAVTIANNLVRKNILFKKPGKIETFAAMALGGDFAEIEQQKEIIAKNVKTSDLVNNVKLIDFINLTAAQKYRYDLRPATADNFTLTINRITNEDKTYKIKAVVCFARNEDEQTKLYKLLGDAVRDKRYHNLVFIDASSNLIGREIFTRWLENSANEKYWRATQPDSAVQYKNNADDCLKEWFNSFETGSFVYYPATKNPADDRRKISCQNADRITEELQDNVRRIFPYSFDDANIVDTLFQSGPSKPLAKAGIEQTEYSMLKTKIAKIVLGDLWQMSGRYWEIYPDFSISRLKIELDTMIKHELEKNAHISFDDIFSFLLERGFMPLNIHAFLTGFLLKEYVGEPYRFSAGLDRNLGGALTVQKLAECIGDSIKQTITPAKNYRSKFLEIMSPNQRQFMLFASEVFDVTEDFSVEQCAQKLRLQLKNLGYPFWCYVEAAANNYKKFLSRLANIANTNKESVPALAEQVGQFLSENPATVRDMKFFLTEQKGREIFTDFLKNFEDGIIFDLAKKIGLEDPVGQCQKRLTSGDGIWLRDKQTATDDLKKLIIDFKILLESQKFGIDTKSINACMVDWKKWIGFNLKIPADTIGECYPKLKNFLALLKEICEHGEIPQSKREDFLRQLVDNIGLIRKAVSDPIKILRKKYSYPLEGLNEEEIKSLYSTLPGTSFTDSNADYHKNISDAAKQKQSVQLKNKLSTLWRKISKSKSPREWSKEHRTPILAMVPQTELSTAKKFFEIIMAPSSSETDLKRAIEYLEKNPPYLAALNDERQIEESFRAEILNEDACVLLKDNKEIRDEIESKFPDDAYDWYANEQVKNIVKKFVEKKYFTSNTHDKIAAHVEQMSAEDAKKLLIELLNKNYEVGLKLLKEF